MILKISQCHSENALREFRDEVGMLGKLRGCDRVIGLAYAVLKCHDWDAKETAKPRLRLW